VFRGPGKAALDPKPELILAAHELAVSRPISDTLSTIRAGIEVKNFSD
jgi:hypothetical protein